MSEVILKYCHACIVSSAIKPIALLIVFRTCMDNLGLNVAFLEVYFSPLRLVVAYY